LLYRYCIGYFFSGRLLYICNYNWLLLFNMFFYISYDCSSFSTFNNSCNVTLRSIGRSRNYRLADLSLKQSDMLSDLINLGLLYFASGFILGEDTIKTAYFLKGKLKQPILMFVNIMGVLLYQNLDFALGD
jgi:hypothetical protein